MATVITSECINCGACEPECPNTAIYQGGVEWQAPDGAMHPAISNDIFYIVPEKCTECVGFHDQEACAAVCPVDCCVPDPNIPETEAVLLARARTLHPDETIYTFWDFFRNAYGRNAGLRIDHFLLSPAVAGRLKAAGVDKDVRGWEKSSDHAPVWVELG